MLATASQDGTVRIWDTRLHKQLRVLKAPPPPNSSTSSDDDNDEAAEVLRVAWQHDQEYLATGGADGWVHIYHYHASRRKGGDGDDDDWSLVASIDNGSYLKAAAAVPGPSSGRGKANNKQGERDNADDGTDHAMNDETTDAEEDDHGPPPQDMGPPQIYALQFIKEWPTPVDDGDDDDDAAESVMYLLTSADDFVILWQLDVTRAKKTTVGAAVADDDGTRRPIIVQVRPREVFSLHFTALTPTSDGVARGHIGDGQVNWRGRQSGAAAATDDAKVFGGIARNPNCIIFVFDAAHCAINDLIGAALSDGSLRLIHHKANDNRSWCAAVLTLPGHDDHTPPVHLTSFCWNSTGQKIATALATGQVVVWSIERSLPDEVWQSSCLAIYHGGHAPGRPVFGVRYYVAADDDGDAALLLTWGSDGRLCLWDAGTPMTTTTTTTPELEIVDAPLVILLDNAEYPIYGIDIIMADNTRTGTAIDSATATTSTLVAVAGGGAKAGFLGVPVYLQDVIASRSLREPLSPPDMSSTTTPTTTTTTCRVCPPST
jgi:WD40 repeat protein